MKRAFTLIEILVVISIIGLLMGTLLPAVSRAREQAKVTVVNAELRQIGIALDMYFDDNNKYPPTQEDCRYRQIDGPLVSASKGADYKPLSAVDAKRSGDDNEYGRQVSPRPHL